MPLRKAARRPASSALTTWRWLSSIYGSSTRVTRLSFPAGIYTTCASLMTLRAPHSWPWCLASPALSAVPFQIKAVRISTKVTGESDYSFQPNLSRRLAERFLIEAIQLLL